MKTVNYLKKHDEETKETVEDVQKNRSNVSREPLQPWSELKLDQFSLKAPPCESYGIQQQQNLTQTLGHFRPKPNQLHTTFLPHHFNLELL